MKKPFIALLAVLCAVLLGTVIRLSTDREGEHRGIPTPLGGVIDATPSNRRAHVENTASTNEQEHPAPASSTASSVEATAAPLTQAAPSPRLISLLQRDLGSLPGINEIGIIDRDSEEALLGLYAATKDAEERYKLVRLLALGGSRRAAPLIWAALTNDFSGIDLERNVTAAWIFAPVVLGLLAAHDEEALAYLMQGVQAGFWERIPLWRSDGDPMNPSRLRQRCLKGLAVSMRPEARAWLNELRDHPAVAVDLGVHSAMVDGAFMQDLIAREGLDGAFRILEGSEGLRQFAHWRSDTSNGVWWAAWYDRARQLE